MIPPKRILNLITEHWPLIEALVSRFNLSDFSFNEVQSILKQQQPQLSAEKVFKEVNKLLNMEIIIPLAKSSQLELNRAVYDFAEYLLQEESLGLVGEITVLVNDMTRIGQRLYDAGLHDDESELQRNARIMDERVRKIVKLFLHNQNAIYNIVEQAKSNNTELTLSKRYQAVIEAFDQYIEPMLEMVDINGEFKNTFAHIETQISDVIEYIAIQGKLSNERRTLEQLRTRILDMYLTGQQSLTKSADILMPLREELRRNTQLTQMASKILAKVRKQGVDNVLAPFAPHFHSERQKFSLGSDHQMVAYMAELNEFEQQEYELPEPHDVNPFSTPNVPDFQTVKQQFINQQTARPQCVFQFIEQNYQQLDADELLYLYQKFANDDDIQVEHATEQSQFTHGELAFTLYPYQASASASEQK